MDKGAEQLCLALHFQAFDPGTLLVKLKESEHIPELKSKQKASPVHSALPAFYSNPLQAMPLSPN